MLLKDKNVFLTGGSRGLGRAIVFELVKYGSNVAFTYFTRKDAAEETLEKWQDLYEELKQQLGD